MADGASNSAASRRYPMCVYASSSQVCTLKTPSCYIIRKRKCRVSLVHLRQIDENPGPGSFWGWKPRVWVVEL